MILATKKVLYHILGAERYLGIVSAAFLRMHRLGLLRRRFPEHYFIRKLVRPGDHVIDVGANLGYYTVPLSRLVGASGRVWAVEPVPLFAGILRRNLSFGDPAVVTIIQQALGGESREVSMTVPEIRGILRHGLAHIEPGGGANSFAVPMRTPEEVFVDLPRLDYLKCDVEGYEVHVLLPFRPLFERFSPVVQVEIGSPRSRDLLMDFFAELGYQVRILRNGSLAPLPDMNARVMGDYYFVPSDPRRHLPMSP